MNGIHEHRRNAILQIVLDGAQAFEIEQYVRDQEAGNNPPWTIQDGEQPLSTEQILTLVTEAEQIIIAAAPGMSRTTAIHLARLRSLFARAVAASEHATAVRILAQIGELEGVGSAGSANADKIGDRHARLLREIQHRHLELADQTPQRGERKLWEQQIEHGPLFSATAWFHCGDAERMRWTAILDDLESAGYVTRSPGDGRWPHVCLTPAGEQHLALVVSAA
jgi:hypothetical protein